MVARTVVSSPRTDLDSFRWLGKGFGMVSTEEVDRGGWRVVNAFIQAIIP